ncbi:hypothetical protein QR98_0090210 [Sarcoptes scabiei]|uniref:Uncharacterized protein n=1 Tax=Sarcoptes scabiei TaxID=52283 RepID=A0A132AIQ1_SARSC|nr:hypothetical protein QR98_0090210 [Sarcoptes scabiei]
MSVLMDRRDSFERNLNIIFSAQYFLIWCVRSNTPSSISIFFIIDFHSISVYESSERKSHFHCENFRSKFLERTIYLKNH